MPYTFNPFTGNFDFYKEPGSGTTLTVGSTVVSGATNGYVLYNNNGVLGAELVSGTGTVTSVTSATGEITVATTTTTPVLTIVSAPKLTIARTINGTSFDGSANVTVTAAAGTLTGTTLNSTVVTATIGTLTNLTVAGFVQTTSGGVLSSALLTSGQVTTALGFTPGTVTSVTGTTNRITSSGGTTPVIDISASYVGQSSITTLGTITTGVWTGTTVAIANGGTGQTTANAALNAFLPSQTSNSGKFLTTDGTNTSWGTVSGSGTVTSVAWTTSQGVSASVANSTTTPNITVTLSALTGVTSFNGLVVTANTGVITTGTWNGTTIAVANGGTGITSFGAGIATWLGTPSSANLASAITDETGTGALVFANTPTLVTAILGSSTATTQSPADNSTKVATTAYVDAAVLGQNFKEAALAATTANLIGVYVSGVFTYTATGTDTIDGVTLALGNRVLVKNQTTTFQNGIYSVTTAGALGVAGVLTRSSDANTSGEFKTGDSIFVTSGTANTSTTWAYTGIDSPTFGTDPITYAQTAGQGTVTAGNGIAVTGLSVAIDTSVTVDKTTTQTLTGKTLSGNTAVTLISGSGTLTLNTTGTVTLPNATDTLVGKATTDTLTNKTYDTSGTGNAFKINGTAITAVTGTGSVVLATSPTLVTPTLGVASATTVNKVTLTTPATGSTLTIVDGKTLTANNSLTLAGTDSTTMTFPAISANVSTNAVTTEASNTATVVAIGGTNHTHTITALAAADTFGVPTIAAGSLSDANMLIIRIKDNGTARALAFNAIFRASSDLALPSTTIISKTLYLGFKYNVADTKWDLLALLNNF